MTTNSNKDIDLTSEFEIISKCEYKDSNGEHVDCKEGGSMTCITCGSHFCDTHLLEHKCYTNEHE